MDSATILNRDHKGAAAATYLITFACYGTWLPGQLGVVDRHHNLFGSRLREPNAAREQRAVERMQQAPYDLDARRRGIVLRTIQQVCLYRNWTLVAAHVRSSHVHVIVTADQKPEHVMNTIKAYASRNLNLARLDEPDRRRWARHGSTRYLWTRAAVSAAVQYVVAEQGEAMALFELESVR